MILPLTSTLSSASTRLQIKKGHFKQQQKIDVPVLVIGGWAISVSGSFLQVSDQTGSNWFLLILQTAKLSTKKKSSCYSLQDFLIENYVGLEIGKVCPAEWHTKVDIYIS